MNLQDELEMALERLKAAFSPQDIAKAVAIAEVVKLMIEERNAQADK